MVDRYIDYPLMQIIASLDRGKYLKIHSSNLSQSFLWQPNFFGLPSVGVSKVGIAAIAESFHCLKNENLSPQAFRKDGQETQVSILCAAKISFRSDQKDIPHHEFGKNMCNLIGFAYFD